MSTNNFKFENILITIPDFNFYHESEACDCDNKDKDGICKQQGEYVDYDNFAYNEYVEEMQEQLKKIGFESCDKWESGRDGGKIIAEWGQEDNCFIKYLQVVIRSGYYSGANIDYTIDGDFCPDEESKKEIRHARMLQKQFDKQVVKLEKILRKNGTELLKVAQFSNGEAMYQVKK
jgi:hypothetical protein